MVQSYHLVRNIKKALLIGLFKHSSVDMPQDGLQCPRQHCHRMLPDSHLAVYVCLIAFLLDHSMLRTGSEGASSIWHCSPAPQH